MITRLDIDVLGEEKTSTDTSLGPLSFREVVATIRDGGAYAKTVANTLSDVLLTLGDPLAPDPVDFILIQADHDFEVRVGTGGAYIACKKLDDNLAHAYFLATPDGADGIWVNTGPYDTVFKWWQGRKEP